MKRYIVLFNLLILFGFVVGNRASGAECEKCPQWTACYVLTFDLPGCEGVEVTLCFRCGVTNPTIYYLGVSFENVCPGYEEEIDQYVQDWISNNTLVLCGNSPCHINPPMTVEYWKPLCGDVYWNGSRYSKMINPDCENYCRDIHEWCWCNCVPGECWEEPECPQPHFRYYHLRYEETNPGACEFVPYGWHPEALREPTPDNPNPYYKWRFDDDYDWNGEWLRCVRIYWNWDNLSQNCSD